MKTVEFIKYVILGEDSNGMDVMVKLPQFGRPSYVKNVKRQLETREYFFFLKHKF